MDDPFDIIFVALPRWDGPYSSTAFSTAQALSKRYRVFYIDNPYTWKDFISGWKDPLIRKRWQALLFGKNKYTTLDNGHLTIVTPALVLPINWLPKGNIHSFLLKINNKIFNRAIAKTLKEKKVDKYVYINSFNPFYQVENKQKKSILTIYQSVDDMSQSDYISKHGPLLESLHAASSDFTITTSEELKSRMSVYARKTYLVPNAADIKLFKTALEPDLPCPEELRGCTNKVICYTGNICLRIDYQLLLDIATTYPDKTLLLVGPVNSQDVSIQELKSMANVIFTGSKHISELPAYLKYSHCAIIPFLCNQLTKSIYPLKINEYLAAGKPVVTTGFSKDITHFKEVIYLSKNRNEFVKNIDKAIAESSYRKISERVKTSESNTWEARAEQISNLIHEQLKSSESLPH